MATRDGQATSEARIRALIDERVKTVRAKDANALVSHHSKDVVLFDVVNPLRSIGSQAAKKRAEDWFSSFQGPIGYEIRDLSIAAGDDVAFCHFLNRVDATRKDGVKVGMWWRATVCYRKIDGEWKIAHSHDSVPFDMETGKASVGLEP